jgi:hypothetical protein
MGGPNVLPVRLFFVCPALAQLLCAGPGSLQFGARTSISGKAEHYAAPVFGLSMKGLDQACAVK